MTPRSPRAHSATFSGHSATLTPTLDLPVGQVIFFKGRTARVLRGGSRPRPGQGRGGRDGEGVCGGAGGLRRGGEGLRQGGGSAAGREGSAAGRRGSAAGWRGSGPLRRGRAPNSPAQSRNHMFRLKLLTNTRRRVHRKLDLNTPAQKYFLAWWVWPHQLVW